MSDTKRIPKSSIEDRVLSLEYGEEKTERHYTELKDKIDVFSSDISDIKNAVIGNRMNGENGMVQDIKAHKLKIYDLEVKCIKYELYFKQMAVGMTILLTVIVTTLIKVFTQLP